MKAKHLIWKVCGRNFRSHESWSIIEFRNFFWSKRFEIGIKLLSEFYVCICSETQSFRSLFCFLYTSLSVSLSVSFFFFLSLFLSFWVLLYSFFFACLSFFSFPPFPVSLKVRPSLSIRLPALFNKIMLAENDFVRIVLYVATMEGDKGEWEGDLSPCIVRCGLTEGTEFVI